MDAKYKEKLQLNSDLIIQEIDAEQICLYLNGNRPDIIGSRQDLRRDVETRARKNASSISS